MLRHHCIMYSRWLRPVGTLSCMMECITSSVCTWTVQAMDYTCNIKGSLAINNQRGQHCSSCAATMTCALATHSSTPSPSIEYPGVSQIQPLAPAQTDPYQALKLLHCHIYTPTRRLTATLVCYRVKLRAKKMHRSRSRADPE